MGKYKIKTLNGISETGLEKFGEKYEISETMESPNGIILRSASLHEMEFPHDLHCIARAGAGVNNIPIERCAQQGIVVFNTPGANANAVKELAIASLLFLRARLLKVSIGLVNFQELIFRSRLKGKFNLQDLKLKERNWGLSGWALLVLWLPMQLSISKWRYMDTILISPSIMLGGCRVR